MLFTGKRFINIGLIFFFLLTMTMMVFAQEATPEPAGETTAEASNDKTLTYSVDAAGEITNSNFSDIWTLTTASADRIMVRVERTSGNLLPDVSILNASDQQIAQSYGPDQTGAAAQIENFTLPGAGIYKVLVQRSDGGTGVTTGGYTLNITPRATADDNPNNTVILGEVVAGTPTNGELTGTQWYQRYTFNAQGEDVIRVTAKRTGGTLYPEVEILDANGISLRTGYTDYSNGDIAQIDSFALPSAGTYTIALTRANRFSGETTGTYQLDVTILGAGESNPMMAQSSGDVTYDTELKGEIGAQWYQDWKLTTTAPDVLTLTVTRTTGNLQPEVILLGGSGQEVTHGYSSNIGNSASITHYTLPSAGNFTVRVSRAQGKSGYSTGAYSLMVTLNGSGEGSPNLAESSGAIENTQEQTGMISSKQWANSWDYQGTKDQKITVTVTRTSGTLIPRVDIRDSNGQVLNTGYANSSRDGAEITNYTLPGTGAYKIVVYRENGQTGYTDGDYTLTVEPVAQ